MTRRVRFTPWLTRGIFAIAAAAGTSSAGDVPFEQRPPLMSAVTARVRDAPAADFDGDGDLDVVASASSPLVLSDQLLWLENVEGDGSVWSTHTIATWAAGAHYRLVTGDVDGDGDADVVASLDADLFEVSLLWWENAGRGGAWIRHDMGTAIDSPVAVGDIDGDGDLDVLTNDGGPVWYQNVAGNGTAWNSFRIGTPWLTERILPLADFDRDGDLDTVGSYFGAYFWYANNGQGQGWVPHLLWVFPGGAIPNSMSVADMDRDGDLDLITSIPMPGGTVEWFENVGAAGPWVRHTMGTANFPWAVTAADLDGDGDVDGLAAEQVSDEVIWYENLDGAAGSWSRHAIGTVVDEALSLETADLDGDGDLDILAPAWNGGDVRWLKNVSLHGNACFAPGLPIARAPATSVSSADFDKDGDPDALSAPPVVWHENVGGGGASWVEHPLPGASGESVWPVDRDRDGDPDVVHASRAQDRVSWFANGASGSVWTEHAISTTTDGPSFVIGADLLQDGHSDVVSASALDDRVTWHREAFPGAWSTQAISTTADGAQCVAAADMDRDGDLDVVSASSGDGKLAWYENTFPGPVPWLPHTVTTAAAGAASVVVGDVDHDGDPDLVSAAALAGSIAWHENTASNGTAWTDRTISTAAAGATSVASADLDRDGDLDVLSTSTGDSRVAWHENLAGDGVAWTTRTVTSQALGAASATAVDFDRDGRTDVLAGSSSGVAWHPNRGGQFALAALNQSPDTVLNGSVVAMLRVDASHLGRSADRDLELARIGLRLESPAGPLTPAQANAIIETLRVYLDANANGVFDESTDLLVASEGRLLPAAGVLTVPFTDGHTAVQLSTGSTRTYFVVVELTADASTHQPRQFRLVHLGLGPSASAAEDRDHDIPLRPACAADVASSLVTTVVPVELTTFAVE